MRDHVVLVIGGTRSTGLHAAHALRRDGARVRVLARNPAAASARVGHQVEIVHGDVTRADTLVRAFAGVSHVIFTAGVRSGRFARQSVVRATEYEGVLNTIEAARANNFRGRIVYMTSIGVTRRSLFVIGLNIWKGNTILWRRRAEDAIRSSGLDYTIVRAAFLLNRPPDRRAICVRQDESALTLHECIARADVAETLVAAVYHPDASRATFEVKWDRGPRQQSSWPELLNGLRRD
ncbi:MAG TPA: SDR family oxidoreductase [Longimicrobiales bacterium]|nr:SDR family oxidoreductase [Longimicrobiales bacterium]